jgi:hypothetical protein
LSVAFPPLVAKPNALIEAEAVGVPEPNLTLLHIEAVVQADVTVALALIMNTPFALVVAVAVGVASPSLTLIELIELVAVVLDIALVSLILEPLAVESTEVVDAPLTRAEPSGTLLALALIADTAFIVALPV